MLALGTLVVGALAGCGDRSPRPGPDVRATRAPPALRHLPTAAATVWAVGDGADGGPAGKGLADAIVASRPTHFLYLGDVYEAGSPAEFAAHYDALYGPLRTRTVPTPGNHEYAQRAAGYDPYWREALGGPVPPWFAVRVAGWTILSLSSEAPHDAASPQVAWLRRRLVPGTCTIAIFHRPRSSAGSHGDQADMAPLWDALAGHAALVLNGHDHTSQRLRPVAGTTEVVAGSGGHDPYPVHADDPRLAFSETGTPAALRLELHPGAARLAFVTADGRTLDQQSITCLRR